MAIVSLFFVMVVGVIDPISDALDLGSSELLYSANSTMWTTFSNVNGALSLHLILPIVCICVILIGVILYALSKTTEEDPAPNV